MTAQGSKRVSTASLIATRPAAYGKHRRKSFTEADYARLLDSAHPELAGPIVLVRDKTGLDLAVG